MNLSRKIVPFNGLYVLSIFSNRLRNDDISATLSLFDAKNPIFDT